MSAKCQGSAVAEDLGVSDSYFTEKYLGEPSRQPQTYDNADLTMRAGNLFNRQYLLVHGTADTVVIAQHSMMFAKALIDQGVLFQQLVSAVCFFRVFLWIRDCWSVSVGIS